MYRRANTQGDEAKSQGACTAGTAGLGIAGQIRTAIRHVWYSQRKDRERY